MFTEEQIKEIQRKLKEIGVKDSQFPDAHPLTGGEKVPILQDAENRLMDVVSLRSEITGIPEFESKDNSIELKSTFSDMDMRMNSFVKKSTTHTSDDDGIYTYAWVPLYFDNGVTDNNAGEGSCKNFQRFVINTVSGRVITLDFVCTEPDFEDEDNIWEHLTLKAHGDVISNDYVEVQLLKEKNTHKVFGIVELTSSDDFYIQAYGDKSNMYPENQLLSTFMNSALTNDEYESFIPQLQSNFDATIYGDGPLNNFVSEQNAGGNLKGRTAKAFFNNHIYDFIGYLFNMPEEFESEEEKAYLDVNAGFIKECIQNGVELDEITPKVLLQFDFYNDSSASSPIKSSTKASQGDSSSSDTSNTLIPSPPTPSSFFNYENGMRSPFYVNINHGNSEIIQCVLDREELFYGFLQEFSNYTLPIDSFENGYQIPLNLIPYNNLYGWYKYINQGEFNQGGFGEKGIDTRNAKSVNNTKAANSSYSNMEDFMENYMMNEYKDKADIDNLHLFDFSHFECDTLALKRAMIAFYRMFHKTDYVMKKVPMWIIQFYDYYWDDIPDVLTDEVLKELLALNIIANNAGINNASDLDNFMGVFNNHLSIIREIAEPEYNNFRKQEEEEISNFDITVGNGQNIPYEGFSSMFYEYEGKFYELLAFSDQAYPNKEYKLVHIGDWKQTPNHTEFNVDYYDDDSVNAENLDIIREGLSDWDLTMNEEAPEDTPVPVMMNALYSLGNPGEDSGGNNNGGKEVRYSYNK